MATLLPVRVSGLCEEMRPSADSLLFWVGARCAYRCPTCPVAGAEPTAQTTADLHRLLLAERNRHGGLVVLLGGEPGLRPDLLKLMATIRNDGYTPGLVSTGVVLCQPAVREKLRLAGLSYLRVQLFGVGSEHDAATGAEGSYHAVLDGLRAWIAEGDGSCDLDVALNVRSRSAATARSEIEQLAADLDESSVQVVASFAASDPASWPDDLVGLDRWNDDPGRCLVAVEGVVEQAAPRDRTTVPPLASRYLGDQPTATCLGSTADVRAAWVRPTEPQSNSFNFVSAEVEIPYAEASSGCSASAAGADFDVDRSLWLVDRAREKLGLFTTDTGDFAADEISAVKDRWSHLFVDRSPAGVLDDFREGMRRVVPDAICMDCDRRGGCARRFVVVDGQPFAAEEHWIAEYVRQLRGRVLDVGCGEQLYRDEIVPLVRSGVLSYAGLDPDEPSLAAWRELLPEGVFIQGGIEEFQVEPASYDHLLCLRSLNHVLDLDEAIARMALALKPGGRLLIVETTPFAMLREKEQVAAADRAPRAGHQHYRNLTSEDVLPYARRRRLEVAHHHPIGLDRSNEWILLLRRQA